MRISLTAGVLLIAAWVSPSAPALSAEEDGRPGPASPPVSRAAPEAGNAALIMQTLHPDFDLYIHAVRIVPASASAVPQGGIYSGLVRIGGSDPRLLEDAPKSGRGVRNDVILFDSALDARRGMGWSALILDHEYFHARHLARAGAAPLVDFGDPQVNRDYYEATAWGYVLERARLGIYGDLHDAEIREVRASYKRHYEAIRAFILDRQPAAWTHYRRFMPTMDSVPAIGEADRARRGDPPSPPGSSSGGGHEAPGRGSG